MKKLNKSLICLLLIAAMIVTFAGCGQEPAPTEPEVVPVSMIDIGTGLSLKVGETGTLTATVNMKATNKDVTWASSDEAIVTVTANGNEATVTAVAAGEATITATAADGSGVTASCTVTVSQVSEAILSVGQAGELPAEPAEGITGDITLNSDGTCAINAFYANLNAQLAFETTYEIVDGVLTFAAGPVDATVMGISGQIGTAAEVAGDTIVITCTEVNQGVTAAQFIMTEKKETMKNLFDSFNSKKIMIIGDVMLDIYMKGKVERISPEAPVPIVSVTETFSRLGGAANVAQNLKVSCRMSIGLIARLYLADKRSAVSISN